MAGGPILSNFFTKTHDTHVSALTLFLYPITEAPVRCALSSHAISNSIVLDFQHSAEKASRSTHTHIFSSSPLCVKLLHLCTTSHFWLNKTLCMIRFTPRNQPRSLCTFHVLQRAIQQGRSLQPCLLVFAIYGTFKMYIILNACVLSSRLIQPLSLSLSLSSLAQLRLTLAEPPVWLRLWESWVGCQGWLSGCHGFPASCWFPVCPTEERERNCSIWSLTLSSLLLKVAAVYS